MPNLTLTVQGRLITLTVQNREIVLETGRGKSAYQSYRDTTDDDPPLSEASWVDSLKGEAGEPGEPGEAGPPGTNATPIVSIEDDGDGNLTIETEDDTFGPFALKGATGKSAYQSYLDTTTDDPVLTEEEWSQGGGGGGDYLPLAGGVMDTGAEIAFDNYARIRQTPNDYGLDQVCSVDYVHRWKNGSLYILDQSEGIRSVQYGLTSPTEYFDSSQGYLVGCRFTLDDGTVFECTDNTEGAAVWVDVTPVEPDDSRLSDARTPTSHSHAISDVTSLQTTLDGKASTSHSHGNLTNAGAIGSTSGLPIKTGTSGILEAGAFGSSAGQFAEGNHTHSNATTGSAGFLSASDKSKLDGIASGAEVNVNADWNAESGDSQILNKPTLGGAAALNVGTTAGTVAAGDHSHAQLHDAVTVSDSSSIDLTLTGQQISASAIFGTTSGTICQGNDSRLSDARTPTAHTHSGDTLGALEKLTFDTTPAGTLSAAGEMQWNPDFETIDVQLNGFILHTGQHVVYHVKNSTASTIAKGVPVMFAGTTGNSGKLNIKPWDGIGPATYFMGLTAESLTTGSEGFVIAFGKLTGIQTNGGNYSESWVDGEIIYAGASAGTLTKTAPAFTSPFVQVLAVVNAHASNGIIFVRPNYYQQHSHGNLTNAGAIGSTSGLPIKTGTSGVLEAGAFGTNAGQFSEGNHAHGNVTSAGAIGTTANRPVKTGTSGVLEAGSAMLGSLGLVIDGAGSAITTGVKGYLRVPYSCTINSVEIVADQSGSIVIDIWRDTYANFPPTVSDTIVASAKPTLSSAQKNQDTTLTGWATLLPEGDYLAFNVDSSATVTRVALTIKVTRTL